MPQPDVQLRFDGEDAGEEVRLEAAEHLGQPLAVGAYQPVGPPRTRGDDFAGLGPQPELREHLVSLHQLVGVTFEEVALELALGEAHPAHDLRAVERPVGADGVVPGEIGHAYPGPAALLAGQEWVQHEQDLLSDQVPGSPASCPPSCRGAANRAALRCRGHQLRDAAVAGEVAVAALTDLWGAERVADGALE